MRDTTLVAVVTDCSTLIGCFVPSEETMPLLLSQLESAAEPSAAAAVLHVMAAITAGAGMLLHVSAACNATTIAQIPGVNGS